MGLTGTGTLVVALVLLLAVSVTTVVAWNRGRGRWRWPVRLGLLAGGDVAAVLVVALLLNNAFAFYPTWADLLGRHPAVSDTVVRPGAQDGALRVRLATAARTGRGIVVPLAVPGRVSKVSAAPALVYLPPQYGDPAYAGVRFPVVELLDGVPGSPQTWVGALHLPSVMDAEIADHRMAPTIAVMPVQNVATPRDTECADVVGGPQVDTYLTTDVRSALTTAFRAATSGSSWAVTGYSTGGYCAGVIAARHPTLFAAAASIEGYEDAAHDPTTGDLFGHDTALADRADLDWWVRQHPARRVPLLAFSTRQDTQSWDDDRRLDVEAAAYGWPVSQIVLPFGGHNFATFSAEIPVALAWLSRDTGGALAPLPSVDGRLPEAVTSKALPELAPGTRPLPSPTRARLAVTR